MEDQLERILVYLGPSLSLAKAKMILPHAIFRPPAKQGDIVTDVVNLNPQRIILIDGVFRENLSPWHKEIVYALQYPGVKARSIRRGFSMGALRAAELDFPGDGGALARSTTGTGIRSPRTTPRWRVSFAVQEGCGRAAPLLPFHDPPGRYPGRSRALRAGIPRRSNR